MLWEEHKSLTLFLEPAIVREKDEFIMTRMAHLQSGYWNLVFWSYTIKKKSLILQVASWNTQHLRKDGSFTICIWQDHINLEFRKGNKLFNQVVLSPSD